MGQTCSSHRPPRQHQRPDLLDGWRKRLSEFCLHSGSLLPHARGSLGSLEKMRTFGRQGSVVTLHIGMHKSTAVSCLSSGSLILECCPQSTLRRHMDGTPESGWQLRPLSLWKSAARCWRPARSRGVGVLEICTLLCPGTTA